MRGTHNSQVAPGEHMSIIHTQKHQPIGQRVFCANHCAGIIYCSTAAAAAGEVGVNWRLLVSLTSPHSDVMNAQ